MLHVLCDLSPGGAERLVLDIARRRGHDVATVQEGGDLATQFANANVRVHRLGRARGSFGIGAVRRLVALAPNYDVLHTHLWAGDVWGRTAARVAGVPVVSTLHNVDVDEPAWKLRISALTARWSQANIAVSEPVARFWAARGVTCEVIPNGVDRSRFGAWRGGDGRRIVAVGRLVPQKGFDVLVDAIRDIPGATLDIAGTGPMTLAGPGVRMLGAVDDIPALLADADLLVVPSRWEGFGLVAAEGLAAGIPVIASAVDGLVDVIGDAGVLVPPGDAAALRRAIVAVFDDPSRARALSAAGVRRAERFDFHVMLAAYDALYARVVDPVTIR